MIPKLGFAFTTSSPPADEQIYAAAIGGPDYLDAISMH